MKNKVIKTLILITALTLACGAAGSALAAPAKWFAGTELNDNTAFVKSWIKVTLTGAEGFAADEEYIAEFTVRQWAEDGNYKLVLSEIDFCGPQGAEYLNPDYLWEYLSSGGWKPVSQAKNHVLIPAVSTAEYYAYLKIRIKPGTFETAGFAEYLEYILELTAELLPV